MDNVDWLNSSIVIVVLNVIVPTTKIVLAMMLMMEYAENVVSMVHVVQPFSHKCPKNVQLHCNHMPCPCKSSNRPCYDEDKRMCLKKVWSFGQFKCPTKSEDCDPGVDLCPCYNPNRPCYRASTKQCYAKHVHGSNPVPHCPLETDLDCVDNRECPCEYNEEYPCYNKNTFKCQKRLFNGQCPSVTEECIAYVILIVNLKSILAHAKNQDHVLMLVQINVLPITHSVISALRMSNFIVIICHVLVNRPIALVMMKINVCV
eukprot:TRINITY_DN2963_c0_g2_i3.p1 TRINITY_DN2963_c0_g2~~TRINITY_DN2963_c0_g2_i3.p1  ORF type:complete len:260 (-),score=25.07 TRINITY_DN2963_c0_g2_i3:147-926(-)